MQIAGVVPLMGTIGEGTTQGLDKLGERCAKYKAGGRFYSTPTPTVYLTLIIRRPICQMALRAHHLGPDAVALGHVGERERVGALCEHLPAERSGANRRA